VGRFKGLGLGLGLALGLQLGIGMGFRRNHSWSSIFTPRRGTHEDGGYLFNSIVPVKFTENSKAFRKITGTINQSHKAMGTMYYYASRTPNM